MTHRRAVIGVNGVLCLSVAGTLLFGAHLVGVQRASSCRCSAVTRSAPPTTAASTCCCSAVTPAPAVGAAPDSMTIASIDEDTGRTVLIGLPRNMANFTFAKGSVMARQFPDGFDCEGCYLNGVSTWAERPHRAVPTLRASGCRRDDHGARGHHRPGGQLLGDGQPPGLPRPRRRRRRRHAQRPSPDPRGRTGYDVTGYIQPGSASSTGTTAVVLPGPRRFRRLLPDGPAEVRDGRDAPPDRPQTAVRNFEQIAKASLGDGLHRHPASEVDRFIGLALKARAQKSRRSRWSPLVLTAPPDVQQFRGLVASAIARAKGRAGPGRRARPRPLLGHPCPAARDRPTTQPTTNAHRAPPPSVVTSGSVSGLSDGYAANQADDLGAVCSTS